MKKLTIRVLPAALLSAGLLLSQPAQASGWPVFDGAVLAAVNIVNASITALNGNLTRLLQSIGQAINENGAKVASTVEATGKVGREFSTEQEKNRRIEDARQRYRVSSSICSESGSGGASQVNAGAGAAKGGLRPGGGGGGGNPAIAAAVNAPAPMGEIDAARSANIHAQFCDADDYAAYGGARACPSVSSAMPGADKRVDSVLVGAGPNGKAPDLTFSPQQVDAARMYVQNSVRRSIGRQLRRGEADTIAGAQYIGLMNQYQAILSAAADPLEQRIADSLPNPATRDPLRESLQSPSANSYFQQFASQQAKQTGTMSTREFEAFEVGRRYANTEYQADLQNMSGDNLLREQIRVASLTNWLLWELRSDSQRGNMISGLSLGAQARNEFEPLLQAKLKAVSGRLGGR